MEKTLTSPIPLTFFLPLTRFLPKCERPGLFSAS
jgi:hypothetical protein